MQLALTVPALVALLVLGGGRTPPPLARVQPPAPSVAPEVQEADALLAAEQVREALQRLEARLARVPSDREARWRAARAAVYLGILATGTEVENGWFRRGAAHADQLRAVAPDDVEGMRWALAAKGQLAVQTGLVETVRLTREVQALADRLLARDSTDAAALYALGKLQYEVLTLNPVARLLSRPFRTEIVASARWPQALQLLGRAVTLDPTQPLFRLGLADALWAVGRQAEAVREYEQARDLPQRTPADRDFQARAQAAVARAQQGRDPRG
jgi:tetratricopeptide (TPR) repeat protein